MRDGGEEDVQNVDSLGLREDEEYHAAAAA